VSPQGRAQAEPSVPPFLAAVPTQPVPADRRVERCLEAVAPRFRADVPRFGQPLVRAVWPPDLGSPERAGAPTLSDVPRVGRPLTPGVSLILPWPLLKRAAVASSRPGMAASPLEQAGRGSAK
jgi:hypothetical protein